MARQEEPREVQITLANGEVLHFSTSWGDQIVLNKVDTYIKSVPPRPVLYWTVNVTPSQGTKD